MLESDEAVRRGKIKGRSSILNDSGETASGLPGGARPPDTVRIQSIGRAAALLAALESGQWVALRDLARAVGLAKPTTYNLIAALADAGLVEHDPNAGAYRLGLQFLLYGKAVERRIDLQGLLRPTLVRLCARTRETVNLALPCATDAMIIDSLEGSQALRVSSYVGTRASYHATACGRALLAFLPEATRSAILSVDPLAPVTPHTITEIGALEDLLAEGRRRGWTTENEENEVGSACVAAPLLDADGKAVAAISIAGPTSRLGSDVQERYGALLVEELAAARHLLTSPTGPKG